MSFLTIWRERRLRTPLPPRPEPFYEEMRWDFIIGPKEPPSPELESARIAELANVAIEELRQRDRDDKATYQFVAVLAGQHAPGWFDIHCLYGGVSEIVAHVSGQKRADIVVEALSQEANERV